MKHKKIIVFGMIVSALLSLFSCYKESISINTQESYYSHFKVEDEKVYIYCNLFIDNSSEDEADVKLIASFEEDVKNGLLTEAVLNGYLVDSEKQTLHLEKGENRVEVVFIGEYAGKNQKHDRMLPHIQIIK